MTIRLRISLRDQSSLFSEMLMSVLQTFRKAHHDTPVASKKHHAPTDRYLWSAFTKVLVIIFLVEALAMLILDLFFEGMSGWMEGLLDATMLTLSCGPLIYWFVIRPQRVRADQAETREEAVLESVADGILTLDGDMSVLSANSAANRIFGYDSGGIKGMGPVDLFVDLDGDIRVNELARGIASGAVSSETDTFETEGIRLDGRQFSAQVGLYPLARDGKKGYTLVVRDISRRKHIEQNLKHQALHDSLTGLVNRNGLNERLMGALAANQTHSNHECTVLFLDFDRFKIINDSLGHEAGDQLLISIARRLEEHLEDGDVASRLGGDEFVVLWHWKKEGDVDGQAKACVKSLLTELSKPHTVAGQQVVSTASIGMVTHTRSYSHGADILRDADTAMYHAKAAGKARYIEFNERMHDAAQERLRLESDLRGAQERGEFRVFYQPVISTETGRVKGMEALLRWRRDDGELIGPDHFLEIAEETGLILDIGLWVIREALGQLTVWRDRVGDKNLFLAVNLSRLQLIHTETLEAFAEGIDQLGLDPATVQIELGETTLMEQSQEVEAALETLCDMGVRIALDNFGTGQSALGRLHQLPISILKIDRNFVREMDGKIEYAAVVHSIVTLAHNLDLIVVAEGVENASQFAEVQTLDCDLAQGHYVASGMSADEATSLLEMEWADVQAMGA